MSISLYEGLLAGLRAAISLGIGKVVVKGDSQLVIKQVNKEYASPQMAPYVEAAYINVRRFHYILLIIRLEEGEVEVWDSLRTDQDDYKSVRLMLKR